MIFYYGPTEVAEVLLCAIDSSVLLLCAQPTNCTCDVRDMNRSSRKPQMACCFHTSISAQYVKGLNSNCKEV